MNNCLLHCLLHRTLRRFQKLVQWWKANFEYFFDYLCLKSRKKRKKRHLQTN